MKRLVALTALVGGLIAGGVGVPLVLTAQPAAAATHDLTAAMRLCENGYKGKFSIISEKTYACTVGFDHHVAFTAFAGQCKGVYDGTSTRLTNEDFQCDIGAGK
jgi:hypothetical protein